MKMIDILKSTLLNACFANGTLLTGLRRPITFLVGMGLKYSCKSILDKSHRCALAPLLNNIFGSIFFFFLLYRIILEQPVCLSSLGPCQPAGCAPRSHHRSEGDSLQASANSLCLVPSASN